MRIDVFPGQISQIAQFDGGELEHLTRELQGLGFVVLGDLLSQMSLDPNTPAAAPIPDPFGPRSSPPPKTTAETQTHGVGRIFSHPQHGCYASLIFVVAVSRFPPEMNRADIVNVAPFRTVIVSLSGNQEDSWGFSTHNREVDAFVLLLRHPRRLSHRLVGAPMRQLLESHLAERPEISRKGNFHWDTAPSFAKYQEYEALSLPHIRGVYERANTLSVAWHLLTYRLQNHERWMGELAAR